MKVQRIEVKNFKAIGDQTADFNGCSAIITGGNNKGKTSLLRGIFDRMRGEKPELILKEGTEAGYSILELTDGSRIEWYFEANKESFSFITKDGFKANTGVLKQIGQRYFGLKFDIDLFLNSSPKEQAATLGRLVGINFEDLNMRYKMAYEDRTVANRELKNLQAQNYVEPVKVEQPDIETLKKQKEQAVKDWEATSQLYSNQNTRLQNEYDDAVKAELIEIQRYNAKQQEIYNKVSDVGLAIEEINTTLIYDLGQFWDKEAALKYYNELPRPLPPKELISTIEKPNFISAPPRTEIEAIEAKIEIANKQQSQYNDYAKDLEIFNNWQARLKAANEKAIKADKAVKDIEAEKIQKIKDAKIPNEFSFNEDGITYLGLPLSNNQISSSGKYIAALKLNYLVLGEIFTMHFDASFLDKNSLNEIIDWANGLDLQLLIERPDFEAGDIKYELINS